MTSDRGLPIGWEAIRLGEVIELSKEKVNPQEVHEIPYIGLEHIDKETGKLLGHGFSEEVRSTKSVFHSGDILYGKLRPYLNKVCIPQFEGICSTDILVYPKSSYILNKFLYYRFLSNDFVQYASQNMSGVQHPRVNSKILADFYIGIPPLPEQKRIVVKIEELFTKLDAGVTELQKAKAQLKRYRQAVLKAAVEGELTRKWREACRDELEPASELLERILAERRLKWEEEELTKMRAKGKVPKDDKWKSKYKEPEKPDMYGFPEVPDGWMWICLEQLSNIQTGATPLRSNPLYWNGGTIPWVTSGAINEPYVSAPSELITELALRGTNTKLFPKNSLLVAMYGEGKTRGKVSELLIEASTNQAIAALIFEGSAEVVRLYIKIFFLDYYNEIRRKSSGGVQPNLNLGIIKSTIVPLPSLYEQKRIVERVDRRLSVTEEIEKQLDKDLLLSERLRQSILKRAFEGKLVPQDPDEAPASVLLEKITVEKSREGKSKITSSNKPKQLNLFNKAKNNRDEG